MIVLANLLFGKSSLVVSPIDCLIVIILTFVWVGMRPILAVKTVWTLALPIAGDVRVALALRFEAVVRQALFVIKAPLTEHPDPLCVLHEIFSFVGRNTGVEIDTVL